MSLEEADAILAQHGFVDAEAELCKNWHHGSREGHGNYMSGYYDNNIIVEDIVGRPIPFKQIGELES